MNSPGPVLLGQLLERHVPALTLLARRWCATAEDVVQEAFIQLARQSECPREPAAWLYRVVRNGAISAGRAETRRRRHEQTAASHLNRWFQDSPETMIDSQTAAAALAQLPDEQLEVIVAHVWGGLSFSQIAEFVESSLSTVHRHYHAGIVALRVLLGEKCPTNDSKKNCPTN
jgi:RNA polymerase sigma-70 factor (ECF subfamily)